MALPVRWTENALEDYENIIGYLLEEWSVDIATKFIDIVEARLATLSVFPYIGIRSAKEDTIRAIALTKHNRRYYQVTSQSVLVLNIFDTRQDPKKNRYE